MAICWFNKKCRQCIIVPPHCSADVQSNLHSNGGNKGTVGLGYFIIPRTHKANKSFLRSKQTNAEYIGGIIHHSGRSRPIIPSCHPPPPFYRNSISSTSSFTSSSMTTETPHFIQLLLSTKCQIRMCAKFGTHGKSDTSEAFCCCLLGTRLSLPNIKYLAPSTKHQDTRFYTNNFCVFIFNAKLMPRLHTGFFFYIYLVMFKLANVQMPTFNIMLFPHQSSCRPTCFLFFQPDG